MFISLTIIAENADSPRDTYRSLTYNKWERRKEVKSRLKS